jgi:chemotaxis protein MotB
MRRRRSHGNPEADDTSFWVSFSDVATALMMVFILLVVLQIRDSGFLASLGKTQEQREASKKLAESLIERQGIITKLRLEFGDKAEIDTKTGTFTIDAGLLFAKDKWVLKPENKPYLAKVVRKYATVVLSPEYRDSIGQIDIEGHADPDGVPGLDPYLSNLELTQNRARAVAAFVVTDPNCMPQSLRREFKKVLSVNGRSSEQLIYKDSAQTIPDKEKSRRVVLKFRLKDDQLNELVGALKQ